MPPVTISTASGVCHIKLNRPEKLNALNDDVRQGLQEAFASLSEDASTRVAVLSGEGRCFSAGADLVGGALAPSGADTWVERRRVFGGWQRLLELMESVPQVTVASIHGHCIGGAALLAAACDIRIGTDDLSVRIPELAIGIPLTWAGVPRLIREIGLPLTRDLVMTGRVMEASEAKVCGFVQRLVEAGDLEESTRAAVDELMEMPPGPLSITRSMLSAISRHELGTSGWADADLLSWSGREPESHEAARSYAKRISKK